MIKLTELFNEIKVNNPNEVFQVTEEGRKTVEEAYQIILLVKKYLDIDSPHEIDDFNQDKYVKADLFYILSSKYGENVIRDGGINKVNDYIQRYIKVWGDKETGLEDLKSFKEYGWIK